MKILERYISEPETLWLLKKVIGSFEKSPGKGLPLGNLTSQLLVNVYMNGFDQFVKHELKVKHYVRYADDFAILSSNHDWLRIILPEINNFLGNRLKLFLHPNKVSIRTWSSGIDFLGWICFPDHEVLRTATKRRALKNIAANQNPAKVASYLGMLQHGNAKGIEVKISKLTHLAPEPFPC
jgi:RNA-directed DNA polymerase